MKNVTQKIKRADGLVQRERKDISLFLNYGISDLLNSSILNEYGLPVHHLNTVVLPDFIALNSERAKFHKTPLTAVGFYTYDRNFDKIDGLYNAIYYKDSKLLSQYIDMYKGVKFIIAPDYSIFDDIWRFENESRILKIRVIMLWFVMVIGAIVIPNAVYTTQENLPMYLSGFENCSAMCFSTKGHICNSAERKRVEDTVKYVVDNFALRDILVYSVCGNDKTSLRLFDYAFEKGINVYLIDNTLRQRNKFLMEKRSKV